VLTERRVFLVDDDDDDDDDDDEDENDDDKCVGVCNCRMRSFTRTNLPSFNWVTNSSETG
jgi:hypothetical protein